MSELNICLVSKRFPILSTSGEYGFLWPIARGLVKLGHSVSVLTWRNRDHLDFIEHDGVKAYFLGEGHSASIEAFPDLVLKKFQTLHKQDPFHLMHSLDSSGIKVGILRKQLGVATVYDIDATHISSIYSILGMSQETIGSLLRTGFSVSKQFLKTYYGHDRRLLKSADAVFVHSPQQRAMLERYYMYPDKRIFMVPLGLEVEDLSLREKSSEFMKKIGLPSNSQVVVTFTDMAEFGELRNLLHAFERVAIKKPTTRLIIATQGPIKKEVEFEMLRLALGGRTLIVPDVSSAQLSDYIAIADVFVNLSARSSGTEQSLLEAMAQKKIIIGSEVSPLADVVEDGVNGFLIRPADTFTLSELLLQIFNSQISAHQMGEKAREKVLNLFDSKKMLDQTLAAYWQARSRFVTAHRPLFSLARPIGSQ